MPASAILYIFVFFIVLVIFIEYINDKKYQAKKDKKRRKTTPKKPTEPIKEIIEEESIPQVEPESQVEEAPEEGVTIQPRPVEEIEPEEIIEEVKELPECKYPPFTHVRLVEMGLSDDEATEFVHELIPQLEGEVPLLKEAINNADIPQIERLTHGIKGSATNLGTGGVADLLTEFNTYLKDGTDTDILKAYHKHFVHYIEELKKQYT